MPTNGNCCPTTGLPLPAVPGPALPDSVFNPCETATYVKICSDTLPAPITVTGADCAGAPLPVTNANVVLTVPAPGAVQPTSLCPNPQLAAILTELQKPRYDIEVQTCNDSVDDWLLVIDKNELIAGLPTISYTNLTTAATQAVRPANLLCASPEEIELVPLKGCLNGVNVTGYTAIKDRATSSPSTVWTLWLNPITGALGAADPAMVIGECKAQTSIDRPICSNTTAGEFWNMVERTSTNAAGAVTINYFDPDTSPMLDVTALFASIRHGGACDCCNEKPCVFEKYHENLSPTATLMAVYGTEFKDTLGFVNPFTGQIVNAGTVPGANFNALGLDKSTNNAVFIDRNNGNIYTAYSPNYAITLASVLQPGTVPFENAILGALNSQQQWWIGGITDNDDNVATINVAKVNPLTGVQTAVPSLTAILNSGAYGFDFDFSPSDDLYALIGLNIYVSTKVTNYAGWASVGLLTGLTSTTGSMAYDVGILRGVSAGQLWAYDLATGLTTITAALPPEISFADLAGAVDPVCKQVFRNSCTGVFYELDQTTVYTPASTPIKGACS